MKWKYAQVESVVQKLSQKKRWRYAQVAPPIEPENPKMIQSNESSGNISDPRIKQVREEVIEIIGDKINDPMVSNALDQCFKETLDPTSKNILSCLKKKLNLGAGTPPGKFKDLLNQIENFVSGTPMSPMGTLQDLKNRKLTDVNTKDIVNMFSETKK